MDSKTANFLFYSNQCEMCKNLLIILKSNNMISYFTLLCVDDERVFARLPKIITRVPTIIIPSLNKQLVANEIFIWLQNLKQMKNQRSQFTSEKMQLENNQTQQDRREVRTGHKREEPMRHNNQPPPPMQANQPLGFISQEMGGLSDSYAYTTIDQAPRHSYLSYSDLGKDGIFTAPESKEKIEPRNQKNYLTDLRKRREEQDNSISEIIEKQIQNIDYVKQKQMETDRIISKIVDRQQQNINALF